MPTSRASCGSADAVSPVSRIGAAIGHLQEELNALENHLIKLIKEKKMQEQKISSKRPPNKRASDKRASEQVMENHQTNTHLQRTPIAIVGIASVFPQARNLQEYWQNIIHKNDCITDVPPSRWDIETYYDPNPRARDKTYCKRGGFIPDIDFDPMEFGLPPNLLEATDVSQLLSLVIAKQAMEDAGYGNDRNFDREQVGVILGAAAGRQLSVPYSARLQYPVWENVLRNSGFSNQETQTIVTKIKSAYQEWEENAFPGMLSNVIAGRITNRLDFGGTNCTIDAACASSLAAFKMAISELVEHRCNMVITGGVDLDNSVFTYLCFSKTPALSLKQQTRPFDAESDGMMLGEGIGMMVLKRLEDAERDGDRIYAVIKGIGTSSDGKYKSIYAPRPEGQVKALRRAYQDADISPATVGLIEAHGTGTMAGDPTEFKALNEVFSESLAQPQKVALGSVKSQIGHTKAAAGAASLIKAALALHHKILPPTINITQPNPKLNIDASPFYLNTETRPWVRAEGEPPRRAGVSSFGFGGTNYHIVLEEYQAEHNQNYRLHQTPQLFLLNAPSATKLLAECEAVLLQLQSDRGHQHYLERIEACNSLEAPVTHARVGFVTASLQEACSKLQVSIDWLKRQPQAESWEHPQGIFYRQVGLELKGKVVALFSGQGSQYPGMGRELAINFPRLRQTYGQIDRLFLQAGMQPVSQVVFPPPVFSAEQLQAQAALLQRTEYAQPAIGAFSVGLYQILQQAGFKPDFVAGHSFGEVTALWAAGVLSDADYFFLVKARGEAMAMPVDPNFDAGTMLAVKGEVNQVRAVVEQFPQVAIANWNSNRQVVLAGTKPELTRVQQALQTQGYAAVWLPVSAAFHTPLVAYAQKPFAEAVEKVTLQPAQLPIYTNVTGESYPRDSQSIQEILKAHLSQPVLFKQEIENLYAAGGYCFIEFGPRSILTHLVQDILGDRPHLAISLNPSRQKDSDRQLREAVVQLRVAGLPLKNLDPYQRQQPIPAAQTRKGLNVRLNGSNYISEKTKTTFERALQNGHSISAIGQSELISDATQTKSQTNGHSAKSSPVPVQANSNGHSMRALTMTPIQGEFQTNGHSTKPPTVMEPQADTNPVSSTPAPSVPESVSEPVSEPVAERKIPSPFRFTDSQRFFDSLEYSMAQLNQHHNRALQVHEQYLNNHQEYAKTCFQLIQQQERLLANVEPTHEQNVELSQAILKSLERSFVPFHSNQSETLRVHEQYLDHQVECSKNLFQFTYRNYSALLTGTPHQATEPIAAAPTVTVPERQQTSSASQPVIDRPDRIDVTSSAEPIAIPRAKSDVATGLKSGSTAGSSPVPVHATDPEPMDNPDYPLIDSDTATNNLPEALPLVSPSAPLVFDFAEFSQTLLAIVSDKTGYPVEMLELEMDMEADLGIDSIKRVEILGAIQDHYPDLPQPDPEALMERRTLNQILEYLQAQVAEAAPTPAMAVIEQFKEVDRVQDLPTSELDRAPDSVPDLEPNLVSNSVPDSAPSFVSELASVAAPTSSPAPEEVQNRADRLPVPESPIGISQTELSTTEPSTALPDLDLTDLSPILLDVVSDKTGYPAEMLDMDMDMEADLGIDSIKRVEILGALLEKFPDLPKPDLEAMAELRTLGQVSDYMQAQAAEMATPVGKKNSPVSLALSHAS